MIDVLNENLVSLNEAAKLIPPGRSGRPTHTATIYRWIKPGLHGVRLEAVRLGGRWLTSREALRRFAERLTAGETGIEAGVATAAGDRRAAAEEADEELARLGL